VATADRMFDDFQRYIFEFAETHGVNELSIHCERPQPVHAKKFGEQPVLCQGHLSTSEWALVVYAHQLGIRAYVIPVNYLVGFREREDAFVPYFDMEAENIRGHFNWKVEDKPVSNELLSVITKRMFGHLIKVVIGEAQYTERFYLSAEPPKPVKAPEPVRLAESDRVELLTDSAPPAAQPQHRQPPYAGQYANAGYGQPQPAPYPPPQYQAPYPQPQQQPRYAPPQQYQQPQYQPQHAPHQPELSPYGGQYPQQHQLPTHAVQPGSPPSSNPAVAAEFDASSSMVFAAIENLSNLIDAEMDKLTQIGMQAIQVQDLLGAQTTIRRSAALKSLKQKALELAGEWRSAIS
ncbi:MAG TPA: hypothetical protein V6C72_20205, partial [Chroococcales cyanobacterium]